MALSVVYSVHDQHLRDELKKLRRHLPEETAVLVGGRAAHAYAEVLDEIAAVRLHDITSLREELWALRSQKT